MAKERKFASIDLIEQAADRVARAHDIPALKSPLPEIAGAIPAPTEEVGAVPAAAVMKAPVQVPAGAETEGDVVKVYVPRYVKTQLEERRLEMKREGRNVSMNYLVLKALLVDGIRIRKEDLVEDGRSKRGQKAK